MKKRASEISNSLRDSEEILSLEGGTGESFSKKFKKETKAAGDGLEPSHLREVENILRETPPEEKKMCLIEVPRRKSSFLFDESIDGSEFSEEVKDTE